MKTEIKIGTRGSKLALWQAHWVKSELTRIDPSINIEIVIIKTKGDQILDRPLSMVGGKGLFVTEIEQSLLNEKIDIAVHSMKDMPAEIPQGLCIAAIPLRETPNDILISKNSCKFFDLKKGAKIGTSSLRRSSQVLHHRPDLKIVPLRGNIDTRIRKLETEDLDGIILAAAGVKRLGLEEKITEYLLYDLMLPAVGQGALCIESRSESFADSVIQKIDNSDTRCVVMGERAFLNRLEGSCQIPVAAHGKIEHNLFSLTGLVADINGEKVFKKTISGPKESNEKIGKELADTLLEMGAQKILEKLKSDANKNC